MKKRNRGSIFFTGATASMRGSSGFSAFSSAKFALRALAQSMARELGPQGIHVAHFVIDGAIDTAFIKENFPDECFFSFKPTTIKYYARGFRSFKKSKPKFIEKFYNPHEDKIFMSPEQTYPIDKENMKKWRQKICDKNTIKT